MLLYDYMGIRGDVTGEIEGPARRSAGGRWRSDFGKAETRIEPADHIVLGGRNKICDQRPRAALSSRIDRNIHGFEFELSAEDAAAHHPVLDLERIRVMLRRTKDHRADETVEIGRAHV